MDEKRKILEFKITTKELPNFMQNNRAILANEIVTAAEEMLYNDIEEAQVCKITVLGNNSKNILNCKITLNDILRDINTLLDWSVEEEEYELSHRIKLIMDYLSEHDFKR